jgi:hypothetical protein
MKTFRKVVALALAIVAAGCSDFLSGHGLTENPNNPTVGTPLQQLIAMQANMATRLEGQLARCAGVFTQQLIGSNNQQLSYCTQYGVSEQDISGQMSGFYTGGGLVAMRNIQNSGDPLLAGIAKIWEGLAFGTATSVWGDLPYSEANNLAILAPALDPQQNIYADVQLRLDEGIASLQSAPSTGNCDPADLIYCASPVTRATQIARWIAAANTLKARFYLHLVERNGAAAYTLALAAAQNGIAEAPTSATQAMHGQAPGDFRFFHGNVQDFDANIWGEFLLARQDLVAGHSFIQILTGRSDPRIGAYFTPNSAGAFIGHDQNNVKVVTAPVADSAPAVINLATRRAFTFRQPIVTWAENQLILAEAKFMTGDSAGAVGHVDAVRAAVGMAALGNVSFTDVMLEKHIAMYQNIDVWSDYKRTCIPTLTPFASEPEVLGRMPYGFAERTTNSNVPLPASYPAGTTGSGAVRNWNDPNAC